MQKIARVHGTRIKQLNKIIPVKLLIRLLKAPGTIISGLIMMVHTMVIYSLVPIPVHTTNSILKYHSLIIF
jgi:hypothetical protein